MKQIFKFFLYLSLISTCIFANEILSPQDAFKIDITKDENAVYIDVKLGEKIYIYDEHFKVSIISPIEQNLDKEISRPKTEIFHKLKVFKEDFKLEIPLSIIQKFTKNEDFTLKVTWQGCSEQGFCYNPMNKEFKSSNLLNSEEDLIANTLKNSSLFWIIVSFFGFGLLLSLTPCIFPMIPILSSIIVSQSGEKMTAKKGFLLSLIYVLAMSLAYTMAGILAGLFGSSLQTALQNPYVISIFSGIFVFLAFSMFGFYDLELPKSWQNAANKKSNNMQGKGIAGVAIMGFLSALIVGPCVAAPLAGALIYIGQTGNAILGGLALFVMSLGMGTPLLLIGLSAGKLLPKPGIWMDRIKYIFGVILLALAIWMLERVISSFVSLVLWAILFISTAIFIGALEPLKEKNFINKTLKTFAILLLFYGFIVFIGALSGANSLFSPLENFKANNQNVKKEIIQENSNVEKIKNLADLKLKIKNSNKPVMLDITAKWCVSCKEMEEITFKDKTVKEALDDFTILKLDMTENTKEDREILEKFSLYGPPAMVFFKKNQQIPSLKVIGFKKPDDFLKSLKQIQKF